MHRVRAARGSADAARRIHHGRAVRGWEEDGGAVGEVEEDEGLRVGDSRFNDAAEGVAGEVATAGGVRVRGHIQDENVEGRVVGGCGGEERSGGGDGRQKRGSGTRGGQADHHGRQEDECQIRQRLFHRCKKTPEWKGRAVTAAGAAVP